MRRRALASVGANKQVVPQVLKRANLMFDGITGHTSMFTALPVTMVVFKTQIDAVTQAQQLAATRVRGSVAARRPKVDLLWTSMKLICGYVQSLVDASPANAA